MMQSPVIMVTGVSGFIGGAVCSLAAQSGRRVVGLCRDIEWARTRLRHLGDAVSLVRWDMRDPVPNVERVDAIIHAAGQGDPTSFAATPASVMRDSILGCCHILDYAVANQTGRFVLVSSGEAYGILHRDRLINESDQGVIDPLLPRSAYPLCKAATEGLTFAYQREHGVSASVARLCHVIGPGMSPEDPRGAAQFPLAAARGRDIVLKSAANQPRSWCHVEDAAKGILAVLDKGAPGERYTVADDAMTLTVREFAEKVAEAGGTRVVFADPSEVEKESFNPMPSAVFDTRKIRALGWRLERTLGDAMRESIAFFRDS